MSSGGIQSTAPPQEQIPTITSQKGYQSLLGPNKTVLWIRILDSLIEDVLWYPQPIIYIADAALVVPEPSDESDEREADVDDILDAVNHETARQILAFARLEPMSAEDLADRCETSLPTIYRRINALLEYGLLDEQTQITPDGNHYRTFETNVERVSLIIESEMFGVEVQFHRDVVDKFGQFWRDLSVSTPDNQDSEDDEQASS